jgi:hypothetical protein
MSEHLQASVNRVLEGTHDEADLWAIVAAIQAGQVVLATRERAIAIGGDANNSVNVSGDHNHVIVIKGTDAEAIARLLPQSPSVQTVSVDELVQQVRSRVSTKILNLFSKIRLLNKRQIEVERLYVDVYVLEKQDFRATIPGLLEGRDAREQFDRFGLGKRGERSPGLAIAASEDYPRLMVLGKPGSGKSTFLRYLAVSCAKDEFLGDYIPVLFELRDVDDAAFRLFQWIHEEFELEQELQTEQILKRGKVLILLDGLDEVPDALQQKVQSELRKFAKRYDKNRFILTCRTQTSDYIPEQFQAVEVADFNPEQVESFSLNWFTAMVETPEQGVETQKRFIERLRKTPQAAELAITPVLLSLTCWIFDDLKCLPEKRSNLYRDGLNLLLQQWDEGRGISRDSSCDRYRQLTIEERKQLLSYLAFRKFKQAENFVLFEEPELCGYIAEYLQISVEESRAVLQAIAQQHGLLIERAHRIWSFSHLTFQEYLVAKWFADRSKWQGLVEYSTDFHWNEAFSLAIEISPNTDRVLCAIKLEIDRLFSPSSDLSEFLVWLSQKAIAVSTEVESSFTPVMIRAFYFEKCLLGVLSRQGLIRRTGFKDLHIRNTMTLDSTIIHYVFSGAAWIGGINCVSGEVESEAACFMQRFDTNACQYAQEVRLKVFLEELRNQLPPFNEDLDEYFTWWAKNGSNWLTNLIKVIKYRNLRLVDGKQLTEEQKRVFQHYHVVNWILLEYLKSNASISHELKAEIEETLLLPIAEIEKRKNQRSN